MVANRALHGGVRRLPAPVNLLEKSTVWALWFDFQTV
jgi:hypothetical protein